MASIVRNGWPFRSDFNRVINKLKDSGFVSKWYYDTQEAIRLHKTLKQVKGGQKLEHGTEAFTISQLIFSFYLLGIGIFVASVVLFIEIMLELPQSLPKQVKKNKKKLRKKSFILNLTFK